ncbi:hypothetical protein DMUE_3986 [Dictyocoela muelleri]|nr:hypothetical protein DMUE_3986 [Dictyocoela muelleri]
MTSKIENIYESVKIGESLGVKAYTEFLKEIGVFSDERTCSKCCFNMTLCNRETSIDQLEFRCGKCDNKSTIRKHTFLEGSKLSSFEVFSIIVCYCENKGNTDCHNVTGISLPIITKWYKKLRMASKKILTESMSKLGGEDKIVEIDETVVVKRKYNKGRIKRTKWLFGCIERGSNNFLIRNIDNRTKDELLRVIQETVLENTQIHSDMWSSYMSIFSSSQDYTHLSVNHSQNFVNPENGDHTQSIEALWSRLKSTLRSKFQRRHDYLESYIDEFCFKSKFKNTKPKAFLLLLQNLE